MTTLIVLFNLKKGATVEKYEAWARSTDLPIVRALPSIGGFDSFRIAGLLSGDAAPYQYVEVIHVKDMGRFREDVSSATMQRVAAEFREFADDPKFMLAEAL